MTEDVFDQIDPWKYRIPRPGELRIMRDYLNKTQSEVCDDLGMSVKTLRSWEKGTTSPKADDLKELLEYYRMAFYEKALIMNAEDDHLK